MLSKSLKPFLVNIRNIQPNRYIRKFCSNSAQNQSPKIPEIKKNYYETLGVSQDADKEEIKQKYLDLARLYHPDICKGSDDYFAHLTSAYQTLIDDNKRTEYDNEHIYTKDYFTIRIFGIGIDYRNIFWLAILSYGTYLGYKYYIDNYTIQCPLDIEEKSLTLKIDKTIQQNDLMNNSDETEP